MDPLAQVLLSTVVSLCAGGLAGAIYTNSQTNKRSAAASRQVLAALLSDSKRLGNVVVHNDRTAKPVDQERPRAFIKFPTQTYELALFGGQLASHHPGATEAVLDYLHQAHHVNAMITLFEALEAQPGALPRAPLAAKKAQYLAGIAEYCEGPMGRVTLALEKALEAGAQAASKRRLPW